MDISTWKQQKKTLTIQMFAPRHAGIVYSGEGGGGHAF
jgi:hypothetical protein